MKSRVDREVLLNKSKEELVDLIIKADIQLQNAKSLLTESEILLNQIKSEAINVKKIIN